MNKVCKTCHVEKPVDRFYKHKRGRLGVDGSCKECVQRKARMQPPCKIDGCEKPSKTKGWCQTHYYRWYVHGDPTVVNHASGERSWNWNGGRVVDTKGYVRVKVNEDDDMFCMARKMGGTYYIDEHRLVMAREIGRPLDSHETVHHINNNKSDNRIENLQLRSSAHGTGAVAICNSCGSRDIGFEEI